MSHRLGPCLKINQALRRSFQRIYIPWKLSTVAICRLLHQLFQNLSLAKGGGSLRITNDGFDGWMCQTNNFCWKQSLLFVSSHLLASSRISESFSPGCFHTLYNSLLPHIGALGTSLLLRALLDTHAFRGVGQDLNPFREVKTTNRRWARCWLLVQACLRKVFNLFHSEQRIM